MELGQTQINQAQGSVLSLFLCLFLMGNLPAQTTFWSEDFESDGNGSRYTPELEVQPSGASASCNDYFARNAGIEGCSGDLINISTDVYLGNSGNFLWVGEDLDDNGVGGAGNFELSIDFNNVPSIAGKRDLAFRGRFGTGALSSFENPNEAPSNPDFIIVE
ncbi:MAG: hypothetical protein AAF828_01005 [Bacteroidota bacterium]